MDYLNEFENNYDIDVKYKNFCVHAAFGQDRENTPGVHRLTDVKVEIDDISEKVENKLRNHFADIDYFVENPNWCKKAEDDIIQYIETVIREEI